jgi:light-regulated signal transduction histidine kinase (bacteriophytochrome)
MHIQRVNLTQIVLDIADELRKSDLERDVRVIVQPQLFVEGDPRLIRLMMDNLIGNAWKFTSKHPVAHIEVGERASDGRREFFVRDDGAGFEMQYADRLFGAFQRLHNSLDFPGTGIGLVTVQRIVHRHGGKIWAEGRPEQGATFFFTLG